MRRLLIVLLLALPLYAQTDEVAKLHALFDRAWETSLRESPMFATSVGRHEYDDRMPSVTPADLARRNDVRKQELAELKQIDRSKLPASEVVNYDMFQRQLDEGIEGLIHVSEFDDSAHAGKEGKIELVVGETYPMKIIKLAPDERKIGLSIRALKSDEFRADWETYQESAGDGSATLGDHFKNR
jgi:predicted RNA-binding protein with RPS1 domain